MPHRGRVLVGNWVEEQGRLEAPSVSRNFDGVSCYRAAYTPYVRRPPLKNTSVTKLSLSSWIDRSRT